MEGAKVGKDQERRVIAVQDLEVRAAGDGEPAVIRGYAAVFDEWSEDLGGFRERIRPGAFASSMDNDVRALWNHNSDFVLGRTAANTLLMNEDERGLQVQITPPETQWARDLITSMQRGDVDQMSFGFFVNDDSWTQTEDGARRELIDVDLFDVSVVTYPAYPQTSAAVRSKLNELRTAGAADGNDEAEGSDGSQARRLRNLLRIERIKVI